MLLDSRTRPIHQILEAYLPPDALAYALRLWSEQYVQQQNISMLSFVDAFYHRQSLSYSRQHIYSSLLPALMEVLTIRSTFDENTTDLYEFPDFDLPTPDTSHPGLVETAAQPVLINPTPVPIQASSLPPQNIETTRPARQSPAPEPVIIELVRDERFEAFSTFVRKLMRSLSTERRKKMLFYNRKTLTQGIPQNISQTFYDWLQTENDYFEHADLDITAMKNVVHSIYTGLCNYLGPLEADDILMKSANYIDNTFSKDALDVRDLL